MPESPMRDNRNAARSAPPFAAYFIGLFFRPSNTVNKGYSADTSEVRIASATATKNIFAFRIT